MDDISNKIFERNPISLTQILQRSTVGIAGCGGLGSNVAVSLVRAGIGKLIIVDFDKVEYSNLNRQYYFLSDIGKPKVVALENILKNINPHVNILAICTKLMVDNVLDVFGDVDVLVEAFDKAESKKWLIEKWVQICKDKLIVCANGLSGIGNTEDIKVVRFTDKIIFCGDGKTDISLGLCASRVAIVANMQANIVIEYLYKNKKV